MVRDTQIHVHTHILTETKVCDFSLDIVMIANSAFERVRSCGSLLK